MTIVFITDSLEVTSGWGRYTADLKGALERAGHTVRVIEGVMPRGYFSNPFFLLHLLGDVFRMRRLLRAYQPDIVHVTAEPYLLAVPLLALTHTPVVLTVHGTYAYLPAAAPHLLQPLYRALFARALAHVRGVIAVSAYTKRYFLQQAEAAGIPLPAAVRVIHNGIEVAQYPFVRAPATPATKVVITVGTVKARKGIVEAVRALGAYQARSATPFVYHVIGRNAPAADYAQLLQEEIRAQHLDGKVVFLGKVSAEQLEAEYARADLFLLLARVKRETRFEGFGLVCLEANAHGVPAIVSAEGGSAEAIADGGSGFVVDPDDPIAVAGRISQVLDDETLDRRAVRQWAEAHDIARVVQEVIALYQSVAVPPGLVHA
jgi:glycosyltransferase involved in cell wall biosynthesis